MKSEKANDALNDLVIINNDRYEGYKKAMEETKDSSLKQLFSSLSRQSDFFGRELRNLFPAAKQAGFNETKATGKIYRVWMDVKAALAGKERKSILESCEFGEDAALKEYNKALECSENFTSEMLTVIKRQKDEIQAEHNKIKAMRDQEKEKVYS